jgi:ornithine decarboxylase
MLRTFKLEKIHASMVSKSTLFKTLNYLDREDVETPVLLIDAEKVKEKISLIGRKINRSKVFYAVKANPDMDIAKLVKACGVGFEIASEGELGVLASLGAGPEKIISSNPVKSRSFLEKAHDYGVRYFSYDSRDEVDKMAKFAPKAHVYIRLAVPNEGSEWPLSAKFGVELDEAVGLLSYASEKGLNPVGVTFHVGSQCTNLYNWNIALDKVRVLWTMAEEKGLKLRLLNVGGGYPINYTKSVLNIESIEENINGSIEGRFPEDVEIHIEPGRAVVGDAGILVTSVIGKAKRREEEWLYIDAGVFNGLMESLGGIKYTYLVESEGVAKKTWTLAGPSCDSFDVIEKHIALWEPEIGKLLLVLSGGAYTMSYASEFNGFSIPRTLLI